MTKTKEVSALPKTKKWTFSMSKLIEIAKEIKRLEKEEAKHKYGDE